MVKKHSTHELNRYSGTVKLLISMALAVLFFFCIPVPAASHVVLSWDVFCLSQLTLTCWAMMRAPSSAIRKEAQHEDSSRAYIFIVSVLAALFSLFSVIQMVLSAQRSELYKALNLSSGILCMVLSWVLIHTMFAIRYAHLYYARDPAKKTNTRVGWISPAIRRIKRLPGRTFRIFFIFLLRSG